MSSVARLTGMTRAGLPDCCVDCAFWQTVRGGTDARLKGRWVRGMDERHGSWGRIATEGGVFAGMLQYGPVAAFPRAVMMPAGPPSSDSALITCAYLAGDDPAGTCERLALEALADLKARGLRAVEAFALNYPDEVPLLVRYAGHHTLFDRAFLERLGFAARRSVGQVSLMRLELGGLVRPAAPARRAARARGPTPSPA